MNDESIPEQLRSSKNIEEAAAVATVPEYLQFTEAAKLLRDAEVAVAKARDYYRASLDALNRAVAPLPSE